MIERVILVNARDEPQGTAEKLAAHVSGRLHRAFSVFVLNERNELLLQRRAEGKYHSAGLWSNTCCSHPRPGEGTAAAAARRLTEEMGFGCDLEHAGFFIYRAEVGGGLIEHELDHLFVGRWNGAPTPDPEEVGEWRWIELPALRREIASSPAMFTYWLRAALRELDDGRRLPGAAPEEQVA
jgi:isopentenyl-diphosphate delta-isomerase